MLGMKSHFDISDKIEIREVDIAGVSCILSTQMSDTQPMMTSGLNIDDYLS